ncbi:MAG: hypothetical protein GY851_01900 [bacterium]|nr:hypothetical protein [bacterium]
MKLRSFLATLADHHPSFQPAMIGTATVLAVLVILALPGPERGLAAESAPQPVGQEPVAVPEPAAPKPEAVSVADLPPAQEGHLNVVGVLPLPDEALEDRIVVIFDRALALDGTGDRPLMTTSPDLKGTARSGQNHVVLEIEKPKPYTLVEVVLDAGLRSKEGLPLNPTHRAFRFASSPLRVGKVWTIEEAGQRTVLGIQFSYPVAPDVLPKHLRVTTVPDGDDKARDVAYSVETATNSKTCRIAVADNDQWPVAIQVDKGLTDGTGTVMLAKPHVSYYPDAPLEVKSVQWSHIANEYQDFSINFNRRIKMEALAGHLTITDAATEEVIPFEVRDTDATISTHAQVRVRLAQGEGAKLTVTLTAGLPGTERRVLKADRTLDLVHPNLQQEARRSAAPLRVQHTYWGHDQRFGRVLNLRFNMKVTLTDLKEHLTIEPEVPDLSVESRYGSSVTLRGQWRSNQSYELRFATGLGFNQTQTTDEDLTHRVRTETIPPYVGMAREGEFYFPRRDGHGTLRIESRDVPKGTVQVNRMFPSNIAVALNDIRDGKGNWNFISRWSREVAKHEVELAVDDGLIAETELDMDGILPEDQRGVFCLALRGEKANTCFTMAVRTDIGVLAHWQQDQVVLFVHDLFTLEPRHLAKVTVHSSKNQILGVTNTGEDGICRLGPFDTSLGWPSVAVVEHKGDFTFLELRRRQEDKVPATPGMPQYERDGYDAFVYADRDLYRPGETAHLRWIVRTNYGDAVPDVPLMLKVIKPNGRALLSQPTTLSALGTGATDLVTQAAYPTGKYTARIEVPGSNKVVGSYVFSLEDFVPNRIKAETTVPATRMVAGKEYALLVNAQHLFGAPAAERRTEGGVLLHRGGYKPEHWSEYTFDNDSDFKPSPILCGEAETDEAGNARFTFTYNAPAKATAPMKATAVGRVFELGGRAVTGTADAFMFPSDICLGIGSQPRTEGGLDVHVAAVKLDESPADLPTVKVTLEKRIWSYYVRRYYTHHQSNWSQTYEEVETKDVPLTDGRGTVSFDFSGYGYYRVRVHSEATPQYSTQSFYGYGGRCRPADPSRPSLLKLTLDKDEYTIGEEAVVRVESPFDGKGIVVVQGGDIQRMVPVAIENGVGTTRIAVTKEQFPNVWVEATVIHAIKKDRRQVYPFSSFAMANLQVTDPNRRVEVDFLALPEEIRPSTDATFEVLTRDGQGNGTATEITLAAVDEGIHGITNYKTPDAYGWLKRPRRAQFNRAHYYDKVAYDFEKPDEGGDSDALLAKRGSTVGENWIKPVALWSGVVQTDESGRATVTIPVPEFTGQLRLVAVACSDKALGSNSAQVYVRRPYMLRTSMPRFLLPSDTTTCRAVVFNNSDAACKATVRWSVEGTLRAGEGSRTLNVPPHGEQSVEAEFAAGVKIGQGAILWEAVVTDPTGTEVERLSERAPIPVRTPAAYQTHHELVVLPPDESRTFRNAKFVDDERVSLEVKASMGPEWQIYDALKYVVGYPHGCVEQTTSRLMPMYLLRKSRALVDNAVHTEDDLRAYIQAGIDRLFSMQTASGGLGYWPGHRHDYPYGSVYALHFLTQVKTDRELALPEGNFKSLQAYVRRLANDWSDDSKSSLYLRAYAVYVLALDGDLEAIDSIERFDDVTLPRASRYLLAAALALNTADTDRVKMYLEKRPSERYTTKEQDRTLNSDIRNRAVELLALCRMKGDPAEMALLAGQLFAFIKDRRYGNTQETAFVASALGSYLSLTETSPEMKRTAVVTAADGDHAIENDQVYAGLHEGPAGAFTVSNTGTVNVYVNVTTRGVPEQPNLKAYAHGIEVTRNMRHPDGKPAVSTQAAHGESYVIGLTLDCKNTVKNVVVADLLPAGFEIENPRLDVSATPGNAFKDPATPSYVDIRDDRLVLAFDHLKRGQHRFYYVVRAVTPGTYQYPAVEAECMYDATVRGASAVSTMRVIR